MPQPCEPQPDDGKPPNAPPSGLPNLWPRVKPEFEIDEPLPDAGFETICARYAENPQRQLGAAAPPVYQTSTFIYPDAEAFEHRRTEAAATYDYSRCANPTNQILEAKLARLENAAWADCFGSGMGAISAAINACVKSGEHVVAVAHCYGPTRWYLEHLKRFGVETTFVNSVEPRDFVAAMRPETRLVYLESPTSGRFDVPEVPPVAAAARERGIVTIFDNSWATPYFQRPLDFGVDLVVHSASKYLNGHSDVVAGVAAGRDERLRRRLWKEAELCGAMLDPFAAWLMLRGLRTLALRMEQHQRSGLAVARMLEQHPKVRQVLHPGLESHAQHAVGRRQLRGYSGLFSFELKDGSREAMHAFLNRLKLFGLGVSWGGYESLVLGGTTFSDRPDRPENLIRLSVGLESIDDLIADLKRALEAPRTS